METRFHKLSFDNAIDILEHKKAIRDGLREKTSSNKNAKNAIEKYLATIGENLNKIDEDYERNYRNFYRLRSVPKKEYFGLLKSKKGSVEKVEYGEVEIVINTLREPSGGKNHYSFSTKLLHTLNHDYPIYDSMVAKFFGLSTSSMDLIKFKVFYEFLIKEYKDIGKNSSLKEVIKYLNDDEEIGKNFKKISTVKKIDFIIWQYQKIIGKKP